MQLQALGRSRGYGWGGQASALASSLLLGSLLLGSACGGDAPATPGTGGTADGGKTSGGSSAGSGGSGGSSVTQGGSSGQSPTAGAEAGGAGSGTGGSRAGAAGSGGESGGAIGGSGGAGGGVSSGCGASAFFCEDFEALADGPAQKNAKWEPVGSVLTLDATHARGKRALHVQTQASADAYIRLLSFSPPGNSFFGRVYVYANAFPSAPDYAHYTLVEAAGTGNGSLVRFVGGQYIPQRGALWGVGSDGGPSGDWTSWKASAPSEAGKSLCIEWEAASASNTVRIWINGEAKTDLTVSTNSGSGNFVFPTFNKISIGWWLYQTGASPSSFELWFDDIAFSATRVGCD